MYSSSSISDSLLLCTMNLFRVVCFIDAEIEGITLAGFSINLRPKLVIIFARINLYEEYAAYLIKTVRTLPNYSTADLLS